jgi:hypothetical protein
MYKIYSAFPASSPRGRWRYPSARRPLVSYLSTRNLEETSTSSPKYHVAMGMSENLVLQGRLGMLKVLERLIKGTPDTPLFYHAIVFDSIE